MRGERHLAGFLDQNLTALSPVRTFNEVRLLIPVFFAAIAAARSLHCAEQTGSTSNLYNPENAWTDARGALRADQEEIGQVVSCAEIFLNRSLGHDTAHSCELNA